jgi:hypothetical protein
MRLAFRALIPIVLVSHASCVTSHRGKNIARTVTRNFTSEEKEAIHDFVAKSELYEKAAERLKKGVEDAVPGQAANYYYANAYNVEEILEAALRAMSELPGDAFTDKKLRQIRRFVSNSDYHLSLTRALDRDGRKK